MSEPKHEQIVTKHPIPDALEHEILHVIMRLARICSLVFRQTYYPMIAVFVLLNFTFLQNLSYNLRTMVLLEVALYTMLLPYLACSIFDRLTCNTVVARHLRARRQVHHFITYLGFVLCIFMLQRLRMPFFVVAYLRVAIAYQVACMFIGVFWNVSTQCAAAASVVGCIVSYSLLMDYNALLWICLAILMNGMVATSRVLMRRHTVAQVVAGSAVGLSSSVLVMFVL